MIGIAALALVVPLAVRTTAEDRKLSAALVGFSEVPAVSTGASGTFVGRILSSGALQFTLTYAGLEGDVQQAHIHFGQVGVNGGISVFFCSNLGNGPAGTPACPPGDSTVTGVIDAEDVIGPAAQGIAASEFDELKAAIGAGVAYVNVHSTKFPGGEIRGQL